MNRARTALGNLFSKLSRGHLALIGLSLALLVALVTSLVIGLLVLILWLVVFYRQELGELGLGRLAMPSVWLQSPRLIIGTLVLLLLIAAALFPRALSPRDPEEKGNFLLVIRGQTYAAPYPPNLLYPFGSDHMARDLLSRLIHGARITLSLALNVTLLRLIIGGVLGILIGWVGGPVGRLASSASAISATFPGLLFALIVIVSIGPGAGAVVFVLGLGLTGWASWAQSIGAEIARIRTAGYMEAAEAVGVPAGQRLYRYVLPNMLPLIIPSVAQEASAAMLMVAELGFIGIFYGEKLVISFRELLDQTYIPQTMEWGGMLAGTRQEVFRWWWLPMVPAGAFFTAIVGLNLFADGMRQALDVMRWHETSAARAFRRLSGTLSEAAGRPGLGREGGSSLWSWLRRAALLVLVVALIVGCALLYTRLAQSQEESERLGEQAAFLESAQEALNVGKYDVAIEQFQAYLA